MVYVFVAFVVGFYVHISSPEKCCFWFRGDIEQLSQEFDHYSSGDVGLSSFHGIRTSEELEIVSA